MIIKFHKELTCTKNDEGYLTCQKTILASIKKKFPNLKLEAQSKTDKVHGWIHVNHDWVTTAHQINIVLYDKTGYDHENLKHPRSIKYPEKFPTQKQFESAL